MDKDLEWAKEVVKLMNDYNYSIEEALKIVRFMRDGYEGNMGFYEVCSPI